MSRVWWKDILDVHCTDHVTDLPPITVLKKIILNVNFNNFPIFSSLFEASVVGVPSLHQFCLQCM